MKRQHRFINILSVLIFSLILSSFVIPISGTIAASNLSNDTDQLNIDFDTKLKFYLDLKTKRFLKRMSLKEQVLTQMIQNIINEMKLRGKCAFSEEEIGFDQIYGKSERILAEYNAEIDAIKKIVNQLDSLELVIQRKEDWKLLEEVEEVKDQLIKALDNIKVGRVGLSKQEVVRMIHNYSKEINKLLQIYEDIDNFQKRASRVGDTEVVRELEKQKSRIVGVLEKSRIAGSTSDKVVNDYIEEAANIVTILKQIDQLKHQATSDSSVAQEIEQTSDQIVTSIDNRILNLFGYIANEEPSKVTLSELFKNWKAKKISEYQVRYTKYRILRDNLIKTATLKQRDRMLEAEISDALINYADENHELANLQFGQVLDAYGDYYPNLDGVIFYRSEANFANNYYDAAQKGYQEVIENYPHSKFLGQCYLRLMAINYTYNLDSEFLKYYDIVNNIKGLDVEDINKAHYLAAQVFVKQRHYNQAREALEKIPDNSRYYIVAQYLLGVSFTNLDQFDMAKAVFERLVNIKNYPWTDLNVSIIQNEARLKLGYLHYQRGEFDQALFYFNQISKGYDRYDKSLLAQAWTNLKKGQYESVINKVDVLCNNYLLSNYVYEARVLAAHCKRAQHRTSEALKDLKYVANARRILDKVKEYNEERTRVLRQLDELENLEEKVLEHQNRALYPKIVKVRGLINEALASFRYRGAVSSSMVEEYSHERKILLRQLEEFDRIIKFAEENNNQQMLNDALKQRDRIVTVLKQYQLNKPLNSVSYFIDYPLATKEGGIIYRRGIFNKLVNELTHEKQSIQKDLQIVSELMSFRNNSGIDVTIDLEILEEDLNDLNNQLNKFEVWMRQHQIENIETQTVRWANFSGFGISDINFSLFREKNKKIAGLSQNLSKIESILQQKKYELERRIARFDEEVRKIQKEMEAEKIRLEKLEKEKYFQEIYFETKTREIETEPIEGLENMQSLLNQGNGKHQ